MTEHSQNTSGSTPEGSASRFVAGEGDGGGGVVEDGSDGQELVELAVGVTAGGERQDAVEEEEQVVEGEEEEVENDEKNVKQKEEENGEDEWGHTLGAFGSGVGQEDEAEKSKEEKEENEEGGEGKWDDEAGAVGSAIGEEGETTTEEKGKGDDEWGDAFGAFGNAAGEEEKEDNPEEEDEGDAGERGEEMGEKNEEERAENENEEEWGDAFGAFGSAPGQGVEKDDEKEWDDAFGAFGDASTAADPATQDDAFGTFEEVSGSIPAAAMPLDHTAPRADPGPRVAAVDRGAVGTDAAARLLSLSRRALSSAPVLVALLSAPGRARQAAGAHSDGKRSHTWAAERSAAEFAPGEKGT